VERDTYPEPLGFLEAARRSWWIVLAAAILGGVAAAAYVSVAPATYEASATVLLGGRGETAVGAVQDLTPTYATLAKSDLILDRAIKDVGLSSTPEEIREDVRATSEGRTPIITITVRHETSAGAAQLADAVARNLAEARAGPPSLGEAGPVPVEVLDRAGRRGSRVRPDGTFSLASGLLAGALLGVAVAFRPRPPTPDSTVPSSPPGLEAPRGRAAR
jgi:polysaccharide biosynthesis transport protein